MHARVKLDVYWVCLAVGMVHSASESIQRVRAIDLGLEVVSNHHIEAILVGIKHHDRHRNTLLSERYTLISKGNSQVAHTLVLKHACHVDITRTIASRLDHSHDWVVLGQVLTEIVKVLLHRRKVHLQGCRMCATLQEAREALKPAIAATLDQNNRLCPALAVEVLNQLIRREIER